MKKKRNIKDLKMKNPPPPPKPPLGRVIRTGIGTYCKICNSTMPKSGFLRLFGERLCDNDQCANSVSQKRYRP